jgi:hypothetical protein
MGDSFAYPENGASRRKGLDRWIFQVSGKAPCRLAALSSHRVSTEGMHSLPVASKGPARFRNHKDQSPPLPGTLLLADNQTESVGGAASFNTYHNGSREHGSVNDGTRILQRIGFCVPSVRGLETSHTVSSSMKLSCLITRLCLGKVIARDLSALGRSCICPASGIAGDADLDNGLPMPT